MLDLHIRLANSSDLPRLMAFDHTCISDHVWQLELRKENAQIITSFREVRLPRPISVEYPRNPFSLADEWVNRSATFVAVSNGESVGYISILEHSYATTSWITDLVVSKENRRQGVGGALLAAAEDWAITRESRRIFIEMPSKNFPAIRFALKFGFEFCGYNDCYYVTQDVALFFGRSLM